MAVISLKKALKLVPDEGKYSLRQTIADAYFEMQNDDKSEEIYEALRKEDPTNMQVLMGLTADYTVGLFLAAAYGFTTGKNTRQHSTWLNQK